jgi:hypothetical protein
MTALKDAMLGTGDVTYVKKVDAKPETRDSSGGVTVINAPVAGIPAHYNVSFMLDATFDHESLEVRNVFHWNCVVSETSDRAPYRSVEDRAARQVAPMLRALADKIEADLPNFDASPENIGPKH